MDSSNNSVHYNLEEWLKPTIKKEALNDYTIHISGGNEKGDGYLGDIIFAEVCGKTNKDEEKKYNFVIKSAKKSKELREIMPVKQAFENEMFFYNKILPAFIEFQKEKNVQDLFKNAPKCYDTLILEDMEVLVLENMKKSGYVLHNRRFPLNKQHIKKIIEEYGKLHAISFALRDQKPKVFEYLSKNLCDIFKLRDQMKKTEMKGNVFQQIIDLAEAENNNKIKQAALQLHERAMKGEFVHLTDPSDPYAVILHGDCWNNNFMFKYEDEKKIVPSDVCFIDFQISRLASPVYDLAYFLFTNLSKDDVQDFDEINQWYYESLSTSLREMGSDPNKMFPFEELMNQWKKFSFIGLLLMPPIIKICLSDMDEVPDFEEMAESGAEVADIFLKGIRNAQQYRNRTFPIIELAIRKDFV